MKQNLQEWANENKPSDDLIYKDGYWEQIIFVRDTLPQLLFASYKEAQKHEPVVISTHTSKSVKLPVFQFELPSGIIITMRYNFHDWKVSVNSPTEVEADFMGLFNASEAYSSVYFEGFPSDLVYGSFDENKAQFSIELYDNHRLFTFFWILGAKMGLHK